ncbi:MAG: DNA-processing protein DprA [Candidatus Omnitrophica bacterium]|nr:DNA-processing protein DprA [Candidatus Omnitrophota bacterium]
MLSLELTDWLRLVLTPEIGSRRGKSLLERFKTPKAILEASLDNIAEVENVGKEVAKKIVEGRKRIDLDRQIKLIERNNVRLIPLDSESYPSNLKSIYDPPLVLFIKGEILPQDYFSIAIVGTRLASFYGRTMSEKLSGELAEKGFTIVSGGARGIDTFSHQAALRAKGRTIAILGCGLDVTYPPDNKKLFEEIAQKGAIISEFPLSTRPDKGNFPMRNRIISGLSLGVVVIEAPHKSGALITVTHATEQGREVFSVPGPADSFVSKGTNQLLREGAKLVENADDIIEELEPLLKNKINELKANQPEPERKKQISIKPELTGEEAKVYNLLSSHSLDFDDIIVESQLSVSAASSVLMMLQLKKLVKQSPGKIFEKATIYDEG